MGSDFGSKHSQTDFNLGHKSNPHIKLRDDGQHKGRGIFSHEDFTVIKIKCLESFIHKRNTSRFSTQLIP